MQQQKEAHGLLQHALALVIFHSHNPKAKNANNKWQVYHGCFIRMILWVVGSTFPRVLRNVGLWSEDEGPPNYRSTGLQMLPCVLYQCQGSWNGVPNVQDTRMGRSLTWSMENVDTVWLSSKTCPWDFRLRILINQAYLAFGRSKLFVCYVQQPPAGSGSI